MKSFQHKRGWRNIIHSKPVLVTLAVLLIIFAWDVVDFLGKMRVTRENRKIAEIKVAQLEKQKENLSREIAKLNTDEGKEESIRERFPVALEGEGVIMIIADKNKPGTPDESSESFLSSLFFWKNWFK